MVRSDLKPVTDQCVCSWNRHIALGVPTVSEPTANTRTERREHEGISPPAWSGAQRNWKGASLTIFVVQQPPMPWKYFRHLKHENVIPFQAQRFKLKSGEKKPRPGLVFLLAVAESHPCCHTLFRRCYSLALQDWAKISSSSRDGAQKDNARCSEGLKV